MTQRTFATSAMGVALGLLDAVTASVQGVNVVRVLARVRVAGLSVRAGVEHWAVNIAAVPGARLERVVLYHRPMEVRSIDGGDTSSPDYNARNINSTMNTGLTADTCLRTAIRAATLDLETPL